MEKKYKILVINAGSSSLKFTLFNQKLNQEISGIVERIGQSKSFVKYSRAAKNLKINFQAESHYMALQKVLEIFEAEKIALDQIKKIGHRVVHGGESFKRATMINKLELKELRRYNKLAPLHNPVNILGIITCQRLLPQAQNYAVFDTQFHSSIPDYAYMYALPYRMYEKKAIRRYGFHGISHQFVAEQAANMLRKTNPNLITCHLGSGCSLTAVETGRSVDTSMGFTPLEGLMMSTRSGDLDPAIVLYLQRQGMNLNQIDSLLNNESGLKGICGLEDMRDIMILSGYTVPGYKLNRRFTKKQKELARLALSMFVYRVKKYIGAYTAVLGKVDAIVFTGGIGERNKDVRDLILKGLPNKPRTLVIPTNEELQIARLISL